MKNCQFGILLILGFIIIGAECSNEFVDCSEYEEIKCNSIKKCSYKPPSVILTGIIQCPDINLVTANLYLDLPQELRSPNCDMIPGCTFTTRGVSCISSADTLLNSSPKPCAELCAKYSAKNECRAVAELFGCTYTETPGQCVDAYPSQEP